MEPYEFSIRVKLRQPKSADEAAGYDVAGVVTVDSGQRVAICVFVVDDVVVRVDQGCDPVQGVVGLGYPPANGVVCRR